MPPAQAGLPKGHVPFHTDDEFVSPYKIIVGRQELRLRLVARARPDRPGRGRHRGGRRRVLRPHLLPQRVNGGYLVPFECVEAARATKICTGDELTLDVPNRRLTNHTTGDAWELHGLGEVAPILEAGGMFPYAKKVGMLKG